MSKLQSHIFIATLSTEPQGVTRVLDWLLAQGFPVDEAVIIHTTGDVIQPALQVVADEFAAGFYPGICYRPVVVTGAGGAAADIRSAEDAGAFLQTMYRVLRLARRMDRPIHLSITSGRKTMAVFSMVAAQLLFGREDRVWHMISTERFTGQEKKLHAAGGETVEMVEVPVLRWADAGAAAALLAADDPWSAIERQRELAYGEQARRARAFLDRWLTKRERELVMLLVQTGLNNAGLARRLGKSERTVANQLTTVYRKFEEWRGMGASGAGTRGALAAALRPYVREEELGRSY